MHTVNNFKSELAMREIANSSEAANRNQNDYLKCDIKRKTQTNKQKNTSGSIQRDPELSLNGERGFEPSFKNHTAALN